jgi:hypothetical protein
MGQRFPQSLSAAAAFGGRQKAWFLPAGYRWGCGPFSDRVACRGASQRKSGCYTTGNRVVYFFVRKTKLVFTARTALICSR